MSQPGLPTEVMHYFQGKGKRTVKMDTLCRRSGKGGDIEASAEEYGAAHIHCFLQHSSHAYRRGALKYSISQVVASRHSYGKL
jgi:hypothetical protein